MKVVLKFFLTLAALAIYAYLADFFEAVGMWYTFWLLSLAATMVGIWKWDFSYILYGIGIGLSHVVIVCYGYPALGVPILIWIVVAAVISQREKTINQDESESTDAMEAGLPDEEYYAQAAKEFESDNINKGLFVKAEVESDGDLDKTRLIYIRSRVRQMKGKTVVLPATRRGKDGVEEWQIKLGEGTILFVGTETDEELAIAPRVSGYKIRFKKGLTNHNITLVNLQGKKFSFRTRDTVVDAVYQWWCQNT